MTYIISFNLKDQWAQEEALLAYYTQLGLEQGVTEVKRWGFGGTGVEGIGQKSSQLEDERQSWVLSCMCSRRGDTVAVHLVCWSTSWGLNRSHGEGQSPLIP